MNKLKIISNITASAIEKYLLLNDWRRDYSFKNNKLMVFEWNEESLVIPASEKYRDFYIKLVDVVDALSEIYHKSFAEIVKEIMASYYDLLQFRIKSEISEEGELPLGYASNCIEGLKDLILYSACAEGNPEAVCLRTTNNAKQILDNFRLAQTEVGSFVINIDIKVVDEENEQLPLPGIVSDYSFEHKIVKRIGKAIQQIDDITKGDSEMDEVLSNAYESGVTANICDALMKLKPENSDVEVETTIRYASSISHTTNDISSVNIRGNHFYVMNEISKRYRDKEMNQNTTIRGIIKSLDKKKIGEVKYERKISIISFLDGQYRVVKAELDEESHKEACDAFRDEREVEIKGNLDMSSKIWRIKRIDSFRVLTN
nr:hypothetical protein [uncultured Merdimonas sp.]DAZ20011.1 MAG TPA: hypothetical protein [Caudoviricetes sp.]